jgi:glycosyltransferase involved in cell wall biosynthesis
LSLPLSVVIPTCNRAALLGRTLARLADCQAVFREIVVSDNASHDDTADVVAAWRPRFTRLRYVRQTENVGPLRNMYGVQSLAGERYTFLLSDDDALIPSAIADAVTMLEGDPEAVAVYGGYERYDADLKTALMVLQPPFPGRYTREQKMALARNTALLVFPVMRSEVARRHCFFDDTSFGMMRMCAQLVDQGPVHVVSFPLYQHADTPERLEQGMTEPAYHDQLRSDREMFAASVAGADLTMTSRFVISYTVPLYLMAYEAARRQDRPLVERAFLVRYQASLASADPGFAPLREDWERDRLIAATQALLVDRIRPANPTRLIVEQGAMNLAALLAPLVAGLPDTVVLAVDRAGLGRHAAAAGDYLVAEYWEILAARPPGAVDQVAVGDVVASLRLPGSARQPALRGPAGTAHVVHG